MTKVYSISRADSLQPLAISGPVGCIITDTPYSKRTHRGHDAGVGKGDHGHLGAGHDGQKRRAISYPPWSEGDVAQAVCNWAPLCRGWFVAITDHVLAPIWAKCLEEAGRYVFAPLPILSPGSRVRLAGDGPSSWTCWIVAARPRHKPYSTWGTLPGGYIVPPEEMDLPGGKPLAGMRQIVRDYSRPGDLVLDPCCGAGTTGVAAVELGRGFVGMDIDPAAVRVAQRRLSGAKQRIRPSRERRRQQTLIG